MVFIANYYMASSPADRKVYSNCQQVSLYKNNVLVATQSPDVAQIDVSGFPNAVGQKTSPNNLAHPAFTFKNVAFATGELRADGLIGGKVVATYSAKTPGAPAAIALKADPPVMEANGGDFSRIIASVSTRTGPLCPQPRIRSVSIFPGQEPLSAKTPLRPRLE
jgi:beta-galactosidase